MASKVTPSTGESIFKNKARRHSVANAATRYTDVMKLSKRSADSHNANNEKHNNARRLTVGTTYTDCMKLRKRSVEKTKDSDSSTDTSSQSSETGEMCHAVANVATTFMNVMKLRKERSVSKNGDTEVKSQDSKRSTDKKPFEKSISFELPRSRFPMSTDTDKKPFKKSQSFELPGRRFPTSTEGSKPNSSVLVRTNSWKGISQSISGLLRLRRETMLKSDQFKPKEKYENTYKMSPDFGQHFAVSAIEQIAKNILKEEIGDRRYDSNFVGDMTRIISEKIQTKVKELKLSRYRIVCQVIIAEITDQGIESASRCLWDERSDSFTTITHRNENICAIAMIFGIYYE